MKFLFEALTKGAYIWEPNPIYGHPFSMLCGWMKYIPCYFPCINKQRNCLLGKIDIHKCKVYKGLKKMKFKVNVDQMNFKKNPNLHK